MKTHASLGHEILRHRETLEMAAVIARSHHERYDGNGYPQGLAGADIPLSARLVALADVYDALRTERCYKEAWPHERARTVLVEGRGTQFDPQVVDAFLAREEEFLRISEAGERFAENAGTASPLAPTATAPTEAASGGSFSAMRMPGRGAEAFSAEGGGR
jgi:response regulator RpfG family c-di-GMP phosphodiesterase